MCDIVGFLIAGTAVMNINEL
jgi:hypothetical protein